MKLNINIPATPKRTKILAAFMAFLIFALTFQEAFVGWNFGIKARAESDPSVGPDIYINTEKTSINALKSGQTANGGKFTYTGNIKAQTVSVYDYLSDEEIKDSGSWNTGITKSEVGGYTDPYTIFNTTISESGGPLYASNNNITIVLQKFGSWASSTDEICIFMEDDSGHYTTWPGDRMTYNYGSDGNEFIYTFNPTALGFTPTKIKFSKNGNNTLPSSASGTGFMFKTKDDSSYQYGRMENSGATPGYKTNHTYYIKWNDNINRSAIWEASGAKTIYKSSYDEPLYFGCFLTSDADNASTYTTHTAPNYNNFYWLPNMAQREQDTTNPVYYGAGHSAVQGLVDSTLDANGNLTQGDEPLPYFSKTWADSNEYGSGASAKPIMKYWESGATDADKIAFPFYEVLTDTTDSSHNGATGAVAGTNSNTKYAKYYQFDSKDANLLFHDATPAHFSETTTPIKTSNDSSRNGFFPFNSSNNSDGSDINCGFGTKIEIPFKLDPDGTVKMVNASGESEDGAGTVHARFEFSGDDDLWVFLDDKLMLDMGGAHNKSSGYIDFATKTAEATNAIEYSSSNRDNLGYTSSSAKQVTTSAPAGNTFTDRFKTGSFDGNGNYTNIQHKLTIFYMERGMLDSNLMIRYNFNAESNFSKMKVQEVTSFENVNPGLVSTTMQAADKDVFKYTVSNTGTDKTHVINASIPTNGDHTRTVGTNSTILTKTGTNPAAAKFQPANTSNKYPVAGIPYLWVDDFAQMNSAKNGGSGKGAQSTSDLTNDKGSLYLMFGTEVNATAGTVKKESSAEFEGQFDRYSEMEVIQDTALYTPTANSSNPATLSGTTSRTVSNYYTTHKYIWSRNTASGHEKDVELASGTNTFKFMNDNLGTSTTSDSDSTLAPQMTELFVNTVNTGSIQVTKSLDPSDNVDDLFEFQLQFTKIFGETVNMAASDYTRIEVSGDARDADGNFITTLLSNGKFYLKKNDTATITGIPIDSAYTITETSAGSNYEQKSTSGTLSSDSTTIGLLAGTIVNTRLTGSLTITKNVVNTPSQSSFKFDVILTQPTGVNLSNYTIKQDGVNMTSQPQSGSAFEVTVPISGTTGSVTLSGIPYGTTYSVEEKASSQVGTVSTNGVTYTYSQTDAANRKIDGNTHTVTVTNNYPNVGNLILQKLIATGTTYESAHNPETFTFTVTLNAQANSGVDLRRFIPETSFMLGTSPATVTTYTESQIVFEVTLSAATTVENRTISGLPQGTTYTVEETLPDRDNWVKVHESDVSGEIAATAKTAAITNGRVGNLVVSKTAEKEDSNGNGVVPANKDYEMTVTLYNSNVDFHDYSSYIKRSDYDAGNNATHLSITYVDDTNDNNKSHECSFSFTVRNGNSVTINGIPFGTTFTTVETDPEDSSAASYSISGSGTAITGTGRTAAGNDTKKISAADQTVAFTNKYPNTVGITMTKTVDGTRPNGVTAAGTDYTFLVTLTQPTGKTLAHYPVSISSGARLYTVDNNDQPTSTTMTASDIATATKFAVKLKSDTTDGANTVTISGLPVDTAYSVSEISPADGSASSYTAGAATGTLAYTDSTHYTTPVTIKNTYPATKTLVLKKTVVGIDNRPSTLATSNNQYTFHVTLSNVPNGAELLDSTLFDANNSEVGYKIMNGSTVVTDIDESGFGFDVVVTGDDTTGVTISGIPEGTTYTVEEVPTSRAGASAITYTLTENGTAGTPSNTSITDTITTSQSVEVSNTYPDKGDLVLKKSKTGTRPGEELSYYKFHVVLTAPNNVKLSDYTLTWKSGSGYTTDYDSTKYTKDTANSSNTVFVYDVEVPTNDAQGIRIKGLPYGTVYQVTETDSTSIAGNPSITGQVTDSNHKIGTSQTNIGDVQDPDNVNLVTINNAYSGLVLSKALSDSAEAHDVGDNTAFTYHVSLTKTGTTLSNLTIENAESTTYANDGSNANNFTVTFKAGQNVSISGMPSGTSFEIYEITSSLPSGMSYGYSGGTVEGSENGTQSKTVSGEIGSSAVTVEITNTYPAAKNLNLYKHTANAPSGVTNAKFDVTLWIPATVTVANQNIQITGDSSNPTLSGPTTESISAVSYNKYTVTVTVPVSNDNASGVEIKHLPYGTIYNVVEQSGYYPDANHYNVVGEITDTNEELVTTTHKIGASTPDVEITNNYPATGSLVLKKDLGQYAGDNGIQNTTGFTFEVTLTPPSASSAGGMTLDTFIANYLNLTNTDFVNSTSDENYLNGTKYYKNSTSVKKRFTVTKQQSDGASPETISGLPVNTTYTVEEVGANDKKKTTSVIGSPTDSDGKATGTLAAGSNNAVITNNYPQVGELVLKKTTSGNDSLKPNSNKFNFVVTLVKPSTMTEAKFQEFLPTGYVPKPNAQDPTSYEVTIEVTGEDANGTKIEKLPYGTTYTVVEADGSKVKTSSVVVTDSTAATPGTVDEATSTVTVANTYPNTGSLKLSKAYEHGSEETSPKTSFLYQVVLTNSSLSSWNDYDHHTVVDHTINLSTGSFVTSTGADITTSTDAVGTVSGTAYTFYVKVTNGTDVTISNIPENTTYTVTEMKPLPDVTWNAVSGHTNEWSNGTTVWKQVGAVSYEDDSKHGTNTAQKIESGETDTATITNARISDLTLKKEIDGNTDLKPNDNKFNFTVKLTPPSGMTVAQLKAYSSDLSDFTPVIPDGETDPTYMYKDIEVTYNSTAADNIGTTLSGLPYGTKFDVVETAASKAKTETVGYKLNSEDSFSSSLTANSEIGASNLVTVKNTYPDTGQLILSKDMASGTDDTSTYFIYEVVLTRKTGTTTDLRTFAITADKNLVTSTGEVASSISAGSADTCTFYVKVKKGENVTISGIPQGTTYTVTEEKPLEAGWDTTTANTLWTSTDGNSMWKKVGQTNKNSSDEDVANTIIATPVTNTITNQKFGSLTISKSVTGGDRPDDVPYTGAMANAAADYYITVTIGSASTGNPGSDLGLTFSDNAKLDSHTNDTNTYRVKLSAYANHSDSVTITGIPYGTTYSVEEESASRTGTSSVKYNNSTTAISDTLDGNETAEVENVYPSPGSLKLNKVLGTNAANYGAVAYTPAGTDPVTPEVNGTEFTYKVKLTHANLSNYSLTISGAKNPTGGAWEDYTVSSPTSGSEITITLQASKEVTISGMPADTAFEVYEDTAGLPGGTTQSATVNGAANVVSGETRDGTQSKPCQAAIASNDATTVAITNAYGSVGNLTLNKELASCTTATDANKAQEFVYQVTLTAPTGAKLNPSAYTVTDGKLISVTPDTGVETSLTYLVKVSKNTPVQISGLPYGTAFTVVEKQSGTYTDGGNTVDCMPAGWKYIKDEYGTTDENDSTKHYIGAEPAGENQPRNSYTAYNAQTNTLTLNKELASGSDDKGNNDAYVYGDETFPYTVTFVTPTGVQISDGITLTTTGASPTVVTPETSVNYAQTTTGEGAPYTTITFTVNVTKNQSVAVNGIPYGTTFSVSESKTGWKKVGEEYGNTTDSKHYIGTTGNTYTATNAKANDLTLEKAFADSTPNTENDKMFLYQVVLKAPAGMEFTKTSGENVTGTNLKLYVRNTTDGVESEIVLDPETVSVGVDITAEKFYNDMLTIGTDSNDNNRSTATFKVHLKKSLTNGRIIKNLPYGTGYTVTEVESAFPTAPTGTEWRNLTPTAQSDTIGSNTYTATITNGLTGSLDVSKSVSGGASTAQKIEFTINVELNAPAVNVSLADVKNDLDTLAEANDPIYSDVVYTAAAGSVPDKLTFKIKLKHGENETISGIPYGTTFTVTEPITIGANVKFKLNGSNNEVAAVADKPVNGANDVDVINYYESLGSLKLTKKLEGDYSEKGIVAYTSDNQDPEATKFRFEVVLTSPLNITPIALKALLEESSQWAYYPVGSSPLNLANLPSGLVRTFELTGNNTNGIVIENLPINTGYTVTELDTPSVAENGYVTIKKGTDAALNAATVTGTVVSLTDNNVVEVTNVYPATLNLEKDFGANRPFNVTDNTKFVFNVKLTKGTTTFTVKVDGVDTEITGGSKTLSIEVSKDAPVKITNIPIGTAYLVTEQADDLTPPSANISGNMTSAVELTAAAPTRTVTIINDYPYVNKTVTLYKQDSSNHNGISGAQFYLIRLRDTTDINDETTQAAFANGTITDITTSTTAYPEIYADIVENIPNNVDDVLTTGTTEDAIGVITVTEVIHDPAAATDIHFTAGERYFFFEAAEGTTILAANAPKNYKKDNTLTAEKVITINDYQNEYIVTYENEPYNPKEVDVLKTDENNEPLPGAFFDLFYKDIQIPTAYSVNTPNTAPTPTRTTEVTGDQTAPAPEEYQSEGTPETYKYEYEDKSVPSASDQDWIQPRTDNDYIYFRDYNDGTPGMSDQQSFTGSKSSSQGAKAQNAKRSWLWTGFDDNVHGQHQELDYTHNYWYAAQFSGGGKAMVQYAVWERFVDRYTDTRNSNYVSDTVVWKIQPPDGYTKVRFLLYDGSQCIRTTEEITFKLGAIYHKTSWGGKWESQNGKDCYWNVPVTREKVWSTYRDADNYSQTQQNDKRQSSTLIEQADRYTPTDQKIVFHCNSKVVWHNIHIEFFRDVDTANGETKDITIDGHDYKYVGQKAPGYMMEPYAYAGSDYRINGYLTYELTIPAEAKYFRVNNGVAQGSGYGHGDYGFYSEITLLKHIEGRKNYGNYFKIADGYRNMTSQPIRMTEWTSYTSTGDKWAETYKTLDVDSDYDYVYFEAPASWGSHIYAYFYGGGNLREDNWQRACYSIWPGVAAVSSEYVDGTTEYHSDIYHYTYAGDDTSTAGTEGSALYTGTTDSLSNPESSFIGQNGKVVYKFRIPKGDRKNYSKVIFNNGLKTQVSSTNPADGKTHETAVITYKAGYIYYPSGSSTKHYENNTTVSYTKRGSGDDYIYVKLPASDTVWDDLHVTFYDANDNQILQGGKGYIMEYSGIQTDSGTDYKYFRIPIPTGASRFAVNNGMDKNSAHTKQTAAHYDILRLDTVGNDYSTDYTKNRMVFTLDTSNSTLAQTSPTFSEVIDTPAQAGTVEHQVDHIDYTVRGTTAEPARAGDTLNIRDTGDWNIAIADGKIKFYDENGTLITNDSGITPDGKGNYTLIRTVPDSGSPARPWYTIGIPENAASFSISYHANGGTGALVTTPTYDIYPFGDSNTEGNHTTTGNMYYETQSGSNALTLMTGTYTTSPAFSYDYTSTSRKTSPNGDFLYLVASDKNKWSDMKVVFYNDEGNAIEVNAEAPKTEVTPYYLNNVAYDPVAPVDGISTSDPDAAGEWYKAAIPADATSFTVTGTDTTNSGNAPMTASGTIYRLTDTPTRYDNGWTLGDMQYRLPDSTGIKPTLLYPVFTEEESQSMEVGNQTISDYNGTLADEQQVEEYAKSEAAPLPSDSASLASGTYPVLYETADSKITYEWEGNSKIYFQSNTYADWNPPYVKFYNENSSSSTTDISSWIEMDEYDSENKVYVATIPDGVDSATKPYVVFKNSSDTKTEKVYLNDTNNKGAGYKFTPTGTSYGMIIFDKWNITTSSSGNVDAEYHKANDSATYTKSNLSDWHPPTDQNQPHWGYQFPLDLSATEVRFKSNGGTSFTTDWLQLDDSMDGKFYQWNSSQSKFVEITAFNNHENKTLAEVNGKVSGTFATYGSGGSAGSVTYQPEDRYQLITDTTANGGNGTNGTSGNNDANNFITIQTSITDPYIHFYTTDDGTGTEIGGTTTGIKLAYTKVNGNDVTAQSDTYKIRLPRDARSFKITGKNGSNTVTSAVQKLYDTVDVKTSDGQPYTTGDVAHVSVENFHHAGTTFSYNGTNTGALGIVSLRDGYTVGKTAMADPLNPKSDADYIFFTDTNGFANGGKVYAYFYGDTDGEYSAWPGELATTTTNHTAITTYTDNNGKTVYKFRIPQDSAGTYKKVIFNNGVTGIKITEAMDIQPGANYTLGAVKNGVAYDKSGSTFAPAGSVYTATVSQKTTQIPTQSYDISGNKYIYIINNGTQNLTDRETVDPTSRFVFDELHVTFYDEDKKSIGTKDAGYLPDLLKGYDSNEDPNNPNWVYVNAEGNDVYRIQVPANAKYFQINNGINKGLTDDVDTKLRERYSVIEPITVNGLYKFVDGTHTAAEYLEAGAEVPADETERHNPNYLLTLVNERHTDDEPPPTRIESVKLATIETNDDEGSNIRWITYLKPAEGHESDNPQTTVDTNYLDHTADNIKNTSVTKVKVVKKGTYYWAESSAPSGYKMNEDRHLIEVKDDGVYIYNESGELVKTETGIVTISNEKEDEPEGEVILTKTAKEKVGTTDIGDVLVGAKFKLVDANDDTKALKFNQTQIDPDPDDDDNRTTNVYTLNNAGTYNDLTAQTPVYLETGADGKLHIKGIPIGDYYLEEQEAPEGYSHLDSNTGTNRRIYFSVGANREVKEISAVDEMEPAYIRLFEHISEKRDEWGNPTFVFKIKQTQYYTWMPSETEGQPDEWKLNGTDINGKEILVALTVNDDGTITDSTSKVLKWVDHSVVDPADQNQFFTEDPISDELYGEWLVEATSESEYNGLFRIDEQGRIRVEPGKYEITRQPVSRYEYVTSGHIIYDTDPTTDPYSDSFTVDGTPMVTLTNLEKGKTADIHYYDKVGYYDKFTQVDEEINKFYTLDNSHKNTTVKGIRIADYKQKGNVTNGDTNASDVMTVNVADLTIYKIMSDGSEVEMTDDEKSAIASADISITYTYAEKDDKHFGGDSEAETPIPAQFSYDDTNKRITVTGAETFVKGVYTLKANYKGFTDEFDIVFLRETAAP